MTCKSAKSESNDWAPDDDITYPVPGTESNKSPISVTYFTVFSYTSLGKNAEGRGCAKNGGKFPSGICAFILKVTKWVATQSGGPKPPSRKGDCDDAKYDDEDGGNGNAGDPRYRFEKMIKAEIVKLRTAMSENHSGFWALLDTCRRW